MKTAREGNVDGSCDRIVAVIAIDFVEEKKFESKLMKETKSDFTPCSAKVTPIWTFTLNTCKSWNQLQLAKVDGRTIMTCFTVELVYGRMSLR